MKLGFRLGHECEEVVCSQKEKEDGATDRHWPCKAVICSPQGKKDDGCRTHIPESDFALPSGIPAPRRALGAKELEQSLHQERCAEGRQANNEEDAGLLVHVHTGCGWVVVSKEG